MTDRGEEADVLGAIRWHGIKGIIIPSMEDYGVIFTADPERVVITVPYDAVRQLDRDTTMKQAEALLEPMFVRISEMLSEKHGESRGPE